MRRRTFLSSIGLAVSAGCTGVGGGDTPTPKVETRIVTQTEIVEKSPEPTDSPTPTVSPEPAEFAIDEWNLPERVEINEEFKVRVTIRNKGGKTGTYRGNMFFRTGADDEWTESGEWVGRNVGAGETIEMVSNGFWSWPYMQEVELKLEGLQKTGSIQVVSRTLKFGQSYVNPIDMTLTAKGVELQDSYTYVGYSGDEQEKTAPDGKQFAFVTFRSENTAGEPEFAPTDYDIVLLSGQTQYDSKFINKEEGKYEGGEIQPGVVREGWIAYEIDDSLNVSDLEVVWSDSYYHGDAAVYWSQSGDN